MPEEKIPVVTLTSDFGTRDHYVSSMKAAVLSVAPRATIVDISHDITPHDILEAAFVLRCAVDVFPMRTIHVCVVDPGVGTQRRPILVCTEKDYYVAPDNGVLSFIYDREVVTRVVHITAEHYRREPVSHTFHGRDIFAPAAGWLARGIDPLNFGEEIPIDEVYKAPVPKSKPMGDRALQGIVLHVDRFGNLVTCIHSSEIDALRATVGPEAPLKVRIGDREITAIRDAYMEAGAEEVIALIGSSGFLEIASPKKGAATLLQARRTQPVQVQFG